MDMTPELYDSWYTSSRGRWIGEVEYRLLLSELSPLPGDRFLDVGCGTGWFTRRLAALPGVAACGVDLNMEWLKFAHGHDPHSTYLQADALSLPFGDNSFDQVFSVAALCFARDWRQSIREIVRVTRGRFAIGMLNRNSLLWREKGRQGGRGAYRGALWLSPDELRASLSGLSVENLRLHSAIFLPSGSCMARIAEYLLPESVPWGGFMLLSGDKCGPLLCGHPHS